MATRKTSSKSASAPATSKTSAKPATKPARVITPAVVTVPPLQVRDNGGIQIPIEPDKILKKQEFIERVVKLSGAKKRDVKLVLEAAFSVLGDALSAGEEPNLPPLGKFKVNRQKTEGSTEILILKLRRGTGQPGDAKQENEGLADDVEDE
jgi:hypothetical protein